MLQFGSSVPFVTAQTGPSPLCPGLTPCLQHPLLGRVRWPRDPSIGASMALMGATYPSIWGGSSNSLKSQRCGSKSSSCHTLLTCTCQDLYPWRTIRATWWMLCKGWRVNVCKWQTKRNLNRNANTCPPHSCTLHLGPAAVVMDSNHSERLHIKAALLKYTALQIPSNSATTSHRRQKTWWRGTGPECDHSCWLRKCNFLILTWK